MDQAEPVFTSVNEPLHHKNSRRESGIAISRNEFRRDSGVVSRRASNRRDGVASSSSSRIDSEIISNRREDSDIIISRRRSSRASSLDRGRIITEDSDDALSPMARLRNTSSTGNLEVTDINSGSGTEGDIPKSGRQRRRHRRLMSEGSSTYNSSSNRPSPISEHKSSKSFRSFDTETTVAILSSSDTKETITPTNSKVWATSKKSEEGRVESPTVLPIRHQSLFSSSGSESPRTQLNSKSGRIEDEITTPTITNSASSTNTHHSPIPTIQSLAPSPFDESKVRLPKPKHMSLTKSKSSGKQQQQQQQRKRSGSLSKSMLVRHSTAPTISAFSSSPNLLDTSSKHRSESPLPTVGENGSPTKSSQKETNITDDILMDRAFTIRQNLAINEMKELAFEAEKAAESGMTKFIGSTSKFGSGGGGAITASARRDDNTRENKTPEYRPKFVDADSDDIILSPNITTRRDNNEEQYTPTTPHLNGFSTPIRQKKSFVDLGAFTQPIDYTPYTPSYFARKKIPVTSLRNFTEIVPNFNDMHVNIRTHLNREGVIGINEHILTEQQQPEMIDKCQSLIKNDTDDSNSKEIAGVDSGIDDASQAPSVAASHTGSVASSFSSYAVRSLTSLRETIDSLGSSRPKSPDNLLNRSKLSSASADDVNNTSIRTTSSNMSNATWSNTNRSIPNENAFLRKNKSTDSGDRTKNKLPPPRFKPAHLSSSSASVNTNDSDDSSVEFYGRKSGSVCSTVSELRPQNLSRSGDGELHQPILQRGGSLGKKSGHSVSFETEKANYQALLDRMHDSSNTGTPSVTKNPSFDVDQSSCAASLTTLEIIPPPISPPSSPRSNKSTPMASFLSKIQNQFSRTNSDIRNKKSPQEIEEENKHFVSNFFYTSQDSDTSNMTSVDLAPVKLEINPKPMNNRHRDPFCLSGCGQNDLISACESAGKIADMVSEFFGLSSGPNQKQSAIIDPKAPTEQQALNPQWIKNQIFIQSNDSEDVSEHSRLLRARIFTPPKLSVRHDIDSYDENDTLCSPVTEPLKLRDEEEWDRSSRTAALTCPSEVGCSPDYKGSPG